MRDDFLDLVARSARWLVALVGLGFAVAYVAVALLRAAHPYELEWMEGGMVDHVRRVLEGKGIYARPTLEFVSFLYPPLYYYLSAIASSVTGVGFLPLRLLSFASSLGCAALLFALVRRETRAAWPGLLAAALWLATFERSGGWFDIARADSLFLLLLLAAIATLRAGGAVAAGGLFAAAALVKQSALVIALPFAVWALVVDLRRGAWFAGALGVAAGGSYLALDLLHDGWFAYYCLEVAGNHPVMPGRVLGFWTQDLAPLFVAVALAAYELAARIRAGRDRAQLFPLALAVGMLGASWSVRSVVGAETNNLFPAHAALAILAALGSHRFAAWTRAAGSRRHALELALSLALLLQFALLAYDPRAHLPSAADRAAGDALVARLRGLDGEVFVPHHGYLARLAGKPSQAHTLAMDNLFLDDEGPARRDLERELRAALREQRFAAVLVESDARYLQIIAQSYAPRARLFGDPDAFYPRTGLRIRPEMLYLPR